MNKCTFLLGLLLCPQLLAGPALEIRLDSVADGFDQAVAVRSAGDGSGRLFVLERRGFIRIIDRQGQVLAQPFLDIDALITVINEDGLLGLAFHPDFSTNGLFYVNYIEFIDQPDPDPDIDITRIVRYSVDAKDPNRADPASALEIFSLQQTFGNHNGGDLHFGPDGYLYFALGDGGGSGDPFNQSQDMTLLFGKMLRIDVDNPGNNSAGACGAAVNYGIPADNPFLGDGDGQCDEIWASGLRNPYRFNFDRLTGDLFIGDVGQARVEEINFEPAASSGGVNYGWDCREGSTDYGQPGDPGVPSPDCSLMPTLQDPILEYIHENDRCSVTGGLRNRGPDPDLHGVYFYADICTGEIFAGNANGNAWDSELLLDTPHLVSDFGEDENGWTHVVDYAGNVLKLVNLNGLIFKNSFE